MIRRFPYLPRLNEYELTESDFHHALEEYWDTGRLPPDRPELEQYREQIASAAGRRLPRALRKYLFELPESAREALALYWAKCAAEPRDDPKDDIYVPRAPDGTRLEELNWGGAITALFEVRATIPFWGGHQNVELAFRQLSRREPTDPLEHLIDNYDSLLRRDIDRLRCDHPGCRTPACNQAHWISLPPNDGLWPILLKNVVPRLCA